MRAITAWRHLMSSRVSLAEVTSVDGYGQPTYGTATTYAAHLSRRRQLVRNAMGQEVVSNQCLHLDASPNVQPTARVTLSTADVGSTESWAINPPIVAVERRFDGVGAHHTVVYLG